ncbi:T9SS type A sorting domain-containing protein [Ferruginibacter sp.]
MKKGSVFIFLFFLGIGKIMSQLSVTATPIAGSCVSNAQINASGAGGTTPYQYRLTAGPAGITYPTAYQSGTNFSGLKAGSYTLQVKDNLGSLASTSVTVTTSYVNLILNSVTTTANHCPLSPDGLANVSITGGKAPFSYSLLQGATVVYGPQSSNAFTGIADGTYTAQVTDACGEVRTFSTTVPLIDYKWLNVKTFDNGFITSGARTLNGATPFDSTKQSFVYDGPLLFTCDSITFRMYNTLLGNGGAPQSTLRRVYIKDLNTGTIVWDNTYKPADFAANSSPSVHLKINTPYRFYFDDLCNDKDSADRNYNYNNSDNYSVSSSPLKTCSGYILNISHPSDWNTINKYNSPHDTVTIISSSVAGDTMVGKQVIQNYEDFALSQALTMPGVSIGTTYTLQVKTLCSTYTITVKTTAPAAAAVSNATINDVACKINTASVVFSFTNLAVTNGYIKYNIVSGPSSFTDTTGNVYAITYPITDSISTAGSTQANVYIRNFPQGTYTINFTDQCGNAFTKTFTIGPADVAKISASVVVNQQCNGASSITFNGTYQHVAGSLSFKKQSGGVYTDVGSGSGVNANTSSFLPSYTASALADGNYKIVWLPIISSAYSKGPISSGCDTLWMHYDTLKYLLPVLDSAYGYVCTPGGNDGKVTLFAKAGIRPYQFQRIDGSGNALTPYQTDSTFTGLPKGTYNFRVKDNCGNATIFSYQVDTLKNINIVSSTSCPTPGNPLLLTADSIYDASYSWQFTPAGGGSTTVISNTRILSIPSLTAAQYGNYTVTYSVSGCSTLVSRTMLIRNCYAVLPVILTNFSAQLNERCEPILHWQSSYETNTSRYEIQYSTTANGNDWQTIAAVTNLGDPGSGVKKYDYTVAGTISGKMFYRLKIIDADGVATYSTTLVVKGTCNDMSAVVYPNPVINNAMVMITGFKGIIEGQLYNATGQLISKKTFVNGTNLLNTAGLPDGVYMLKISGNSGQEKLIKLVISKQK